MNFEQPPNEPYNPVPWAAVGVAGLIILGLVLVLAAVKHKERTSGEWVDPATVVSAPASPPKKGEFQFWATRGWGSSFKRSTVDLDFLNTRKETVDVLSGYVQVASDSGDATVPFTFQFVDPGKTGTITLYIPQDNKRATAVRIRSLNVCKINGKYFQAESCLKLFGVLDNPRSVNDPDHIPVEIFYPR